MDDYKLIKEKSMESINNYYAKLDNTNEEIERVNIIIDLFEYLLTIPEFMARQARFRLEIQIKMNEFSKVVEELQLENKEKYYESIKHLEIFFNEIRHRKDYSIVYNSFFDSKVIVITI